MLRSPRIFKIFWKHFRGILSGEEDLAIRSSASVVWFSTFSFPAQSVRAKVILDFFSLTAAWNAGHHGWPDKQIVDAIHSNMRVHYLRAHNSVWLERRFTGNFALAFRGETSRACDRSLSQRHLRCMLQGCPERCCLWTWPDTPIGCLL